MGLRGEMEDNGADKNNKETGGTGGPERQARRESWNCVDERGRRGGVCCLTTPLPIPHRVQARGEETRPRRQKQPRHVAPRLQLQCDHWRPRAEPSPRQASVWSKTTHPQPTGGAGGRGPQGGGGDQEDKGRRSRVEGTPDAPGEAGRPEQRGGGGGV